MSKNSVNIVEHAGFGMVYRGYVLPGKRIEIHTHKKHDINSLAGTYYTGTLLKIRLFVIGDEVEYDSFNLTYTGHIKSITAKNVIVIPRYDRTCTRRLKIEEFLWRNHDFDSAEIQRRNDEISQSI